MNYEKKKLEKKQLNKQQVLYIKKRNEKWNSFSCFCEKFYSTNKKGPTRYLDTLSFFDVFL